MKRLTIISLLLAVTACGTESSDSDNSQPLLDDARPLNVQDLLVTGRNEATSQSWWECAASNGVDSPETLLFRFWSDDRGTAGNRYFDWSTNEENATLAFESTQTTLSVEAIDEDAFLATDNFGNTLDCEWRGAARNSAIFGSQLVFSDDVNGVVNLLLPNRADSADYLCSIGVSGTPQFPTTLRFNADRSGVFNGVNTTWSISERNYLVMSLEDAQSITWHNLAPSDSAGIFTANWEQDSVECVSNLQ